MLLLRCGMLCLTRQHKTRCCIWKRLADLLVLQVPDELTLHYLKVHGFDCSDIRM